MMLITRIGVILHILTFPDKTVVLIFKNHENEN